MKPKTLRRVMRRQNVKSLIIIGANRCNEMRYLCRLNKIILFEPILEIYNDLINRFEKNDNIKVYPYAISNYNGVADFHILSNSVSSSLLVPDRVLDLQNTKIEQIVKVEVRRLDDVISESVDCLIIDAEGSEYNILLGSENIFKYVKLLIVEVNYENNYNGIKSPLEIENYLNNFGFNKLLEQFGDKSHTYADQVYLK